jgi:hypothetical protein
MLGQKYLENSTVMLVAEARYTSKVPGHVPVLGVPVQCFGRAWYCMVTIEVLNLHLQPPLKRESETGFSYQRKVTCPS